ncbi:MAG: cation:proton antiporter [Deltaproteobacteria bacterium]|nr:cation:proton antiporter [Deltaproteobacteria bacterium]
MLALATAAVPKLTSLGGHSVYILLLQLALLLVVARLGGELAKRVSLPSVVGELAAGILLGPTLFGHFAPDAYLTLFPPGSFHYLEVVSTLGMVLLLMLTGLETDVRLLRNLGRPAMLASGFGMVLPFAMGLGLGFLMPDRFVQAPCHLAVLKPVGQPSGEFMRLLVPVDGSVFTRAAVEFAVLYAERAGAELTLMFLSERRPHAVAYADEAQALAGDSTGAIPRMTAAGEPATGPISATAQEGDDGDDSVVLIARLERISPVFKASRLRPTLLSRSYDPVRSAVATEAASGKYDLIVVGTENRAISHRLFFGYENERLLRESPVSIMLVVPKIGGTSG